MTRSEGMTSNTKGCFRSCVGLRVVGVLFDALPVGRRDLSGGSKTLVFEDGYGLTIASNGSFWVEPPEEIARARDALRAELERTQADIRDVLTLSGAARGVA